MAAAAAAASTAALTHLVLVPGHAIYHHTRSSEDPTADRHWLLQPFQQTEATVFCAHIRTAAAILARDAHAMIVFSGGRTRQLPSHGTDSEDGKKGLSEAESYARAAEALGLELPRHRLVLEPYARDSLENVAYALCAFERATGGRLPEKMTVVGWGFKARRFRAHVSALAAVDARLKGLANDDAAFEYVGVGEPTDAAGADKGEQKALEAFESEPLGNAGVLLEKRRARDPYGMLRTYTGPLVSAIIW